ncbi:MAG: hypothetical protein R2828_21380 [Saprospiraceae bacterium]
MKNQIIKIAILLLLLATACGEKDQVVISALETPVLTGYHLRDYNGQGLGNVGAPNTKWGNNPADFSASDIFFIPFPNPSTELIRVAIVTTKASQAELSITPAVYEEDSAVPNFVGAELISAGGRPVKTLKVTLVEGSNNFAIGTADLPDGYYRIYLKVEELLLWDNLLIQH